MHSKSRVRRCPPKTHVMALNLPVHCNTYSPLQCPAATGCAQWHMCMHNPLAASEHTATLHRTLLFAADSPCARTQLLHPAPPSAKPSSQQNGTGTTTCSARTHTPPHRTPPHTAPLSRIPQWRSNTRERPGLSIASTKPMATVPHACEVGADTHAAPDRQHGTTNNTLSARPCGTLASELHT